MCAAGGTPALETADASILACAALLSEIGRAGAALKVLGVKPGDRAVALAEKSFANAFRCLATLEIGEENIVFPIN
jgi:hypothetical protein